MTDYQKYINALRKCAKEHENDRTFTGHIIVSDLCRDTANLLEALEQETTTKNDLGVDYISRVKVIDYLCRHCPDDGECFEDCDDIKHLRKMPSITPLEPKKGHWVIRPHVYGVTYCSECDFELKIDNTNFCPNCGAKMVEPQESEGKE